MRVEDYEMLGSNKTVAVVAAGIFMTACGGDVEVPKGTEEQEVITTVTLTFTPSGGGAAIVAAFRDPDGDGGAAPTIDDITLTLGTEYALALSFTNELEDPPEDITEEVRDEGDEHQVFFTGSAVDGVLLHAYADMDDAGQPLGLANTVTATAAGSGALVVTLRHLPPIDDVDVKVPGLADVARANGIASLPGDTDASVSFDVQVQ